LKIADRVKLRTMCTVYKALHGEAPSYLVDMFRPLTSYNQRTTRCTSKHHQLYVHNDKLVMRRKTISHIGAVYYNALPVETRECADVQKFKSVLYKDMLNKY